MDLNDENILQTFCCQHDERHLETIVPCLNFHSGLRHCAIHLKRNMNCATCLHVCPQTIREILDDMLEDNENELPNMRFPHFARDNTYEPAYRPNFHADADLALEMASKFIGSALLHRTHHKNTKSEIKKLQDIPELDNETLLVEEGK